MSFSRSGFFPISACLFMCCVALYLSWRWSGVSFFEVFASAGCASGMLRTFFIRSSASFKRSWATFLLTVVGSLELFSGGVVGWVGMLLKFSESPIPRESKLIFRASSFEAKLMVCSLIWGLGW